MVQSTLIFGATLIDGKGGAPREDSAVLVTDSFIEKVGNVGEFSPPSDCEEIDATNLTLLPGLIDVHVHLMLTGERLLDLLKMPFSMGFFHAARNLHETMMSGVLTVRDAGGADLGVKRAVEEGIVFGPRVRIALTPLSPTGGPADGWLPSGQHLEPLLPHPGRPAGVCDGVEGVRRKVRELVRAGAEAIKVHLTGAGMSDGTDAPQLFTGAELTAAVEEARSFGVKVMAHAYGSTGVTAAARAGVASVEHGIRLNQVAADALAKAGTTLVPALLPSAVAVEHAMEIKDKDEESRAKRILEDHLAGVERAFRAGVRIAMGSDAGRIPHGDNLRELALLGDAGMPASEAVIAATANGADLLDMGESLGKVEKGKLADLVLVEKSPLDDLSTLADRENILLIMKEGQIIHKAF